MTRILVIITLLQCIIFAIVYNYYSTTPKLRCTCKKYSIPFPLSRTSATLINMCLTFIFLSIIRLPKRWIYIPFRLKYLHIYFSICMCMWSIIHSIAHYNIFIKFKYELFVSGVGATGHILLLLLLCVCILSLSYFRKRFYQIFLYVHYIFLVLFTIIILIHGNLCFTKNDYKECLMSTSWIWLIFPIIYLCIFTIYKFSNMVKVLNVIDCGCNIIEVQLNLSNYYAGKTIWVCCPKISYLEWHPFTVCMYKNKKCYLYYKIRGDWTRKFYNTLIKENNISLLIEGPYYTLPKNIIDKISKHQVVLISTGIGITSYVNIFENIINNKIYIYNLHIILVVRYNEEIEWLLQLIERLYKKNNINIKLYFTSNIPYYMLKYIEIPYVCGRPNFSDILRYNKVKNEYTEIYYSGKTKVGREIKKVCNKEKLYNFYYVN